MNAITEIERAGDVILPLLDPTRHTAMKRVGVAVDAQFVARSIGDWGAGCKAKTVEEAAWHYLNDRVTTVTEATSATLAFIYERVPGGKDTDVSTMSVGDRRELFWGIAREAAGHVARYRADYKRASK